MQCLTKPRQQRYFQPDQLRVPKRCQPAGQTKNLYLLKISYSETYLHEGPLLVFNCGPS